MTGKTSALMAIPLVEGRQVATPYRHGQVPGRGIDGCWSPRRVFLG